MTAVSTATTRAERFFAEASAEFGGEAGGVVSIPMRQCELARRKNVAPSTVSAHLRAMGQRVLQRYPTIAIAKVINTGPVSERATTPERSGRSAELVDALTDLVAAQQRVIKLLAGTTTAEPTPWAPHEAQPQPSRIVAESRKTIADRRGNLAEDSQELEFSQEERRIDNLLLTSDAQIRDRSSRIVADPRLDKAARQGITAATLDELLEPVHRLAAGRGLKPMNNRRGLYTALMRYSSPEIAQAINRLTGLALSGQVTSPFGLLRQWAVNGDIERFVTPSVPLRNESKDNAEADGGDPVAIETVTAWEASPIRYAAELARLDAVVDAEFASRPDIVARPQIRHSLRIDAYRSAAAE